MRTTKAERESRDVRELRGEQRRLPRRCEITYLEGRLGLIIDGTGEDYDKIVKQSIKLKQLGYDTYMIFVNTSLDVALERNAKRERSVHDSVATKSWKQVQSNMGKFSQHFRGNMVIVDNNDIKEDDGTL